MSNRIQDGNYQYSEFETLENSIIFAKETVMKGKLFYG